MKKTTLLIFLVSFIFCARAQEDPYVSIEIPAQNMLKFNRFMINPTFSTVRENKSYINAYHRNQWIQYDEAFNTYLLSYSGRVGDRTGLGLSLYSQNFGTISNFGVLANYAYGIRLAEKSVFTFGLNLSYYKSGFDQNQSITTEPDPRLAELQGNSLLSVQPGFNFAIGDFDIGLYAENLFDYNLKTSKSLTSFSEKTFSGHLQYTKQLKNSDGLLQNGRLLMLARGRKQADRDLNLSGSLILDLPRLGWIQGGFDDYYGASIGLGFNLSKRISLGYTFERGVNGSTVNLGPTHEISFAYSFQPTLTDKMVFADDTYDSYQEFDNQNIADSYDQQDDEEDEMQLQSLDSQNKTESIAQKSNNGNLSNKTDDYKGFGKQQRAILEEKDAQIAALQKNVAENNMLIDEILFRQDSLEKARVADEERRFAQLMQLIKRSSSADVINAENHRNASKPNTSLTKIIAKSDKGLISDNKPVTKYNQNNEAFKEELQKNNIKSAKLNNLKGVESGYYMIANVFATEKFFNRFMDKLEDRNLDPNYFLNHKNNWKYVYLKRYDTWQEAVKAHKSKFDGAYKDDMWIMNVDNGDADGNFAYNQKSMNSQITLAENLSENNASSKQEESREEEPVILVKNDAIKVQKTEVPDDIKKDNVDKDAVEANFTENKPTKDYTANNNVAYREELKENNILANQEESIKDEPVIVAKNDVVEVQKLEASKEDLKQNIDKDNVATNFNENRPTKPYSANNNGAQRGELKENNVSVNEEESVIKEPVKVATNNVVQAQKLQVKEDVKKESADKNIVEANFTENKPTKSYPTNNNVAYREELKKNNIKNAVISNLSGVRSGYYIIANVFSTEKFFNKFMDNLNNRNLNPNYFLNDKNNWKYVYLKRYDTWQDAIASYKSNIGGTYFDDIWIMNIDNGDANDNYAYSTKSEGHNKSIKSPKVITNKAADAEKGYYLIVNVFSKASNADRFLKTLSEKGVEADYFVNPKNNYRYVYVKKTDTLDGALYSYHTNLNSQYFDDMWILHLTEL